MSTAARTALSLVIGLAMAGPVAAATVKVSVVDEDGSPVGRVAVTVKGREGPLRHYVHRYHYATTDARGRAELTLTEPGPYTIEAAAREFIDGNDNPLARPVEITIDDPDQILEIRLELHRGTPLCVRFVIDGSRLRRSGTIRRHELESGHVDEHPIAREDEVCDPLFAGRWDIAFEPPRGYLLVDLDVNGTSMDGHVATLDVRAGSRSQYVTWSLVARARLEGRVAFKGEEFGVAIQAELLEGGPWQAAADARGGSRYTPVLARPDPQTKAYAMDLPDGRWRVAAVGDELESAEPEQIEIVIAAGEVRRQDFTVRRAPGEYGPGLFVIVRNASHARIEDAVVELWPAVPESDSELRPMDVAEPLRRERTEYGWARLRDLEAGSYRLVVGHALYHETALTFTFDPDDDETRRKTLTLDQAGELEVRLDTEDEAQGALVALSRSEQAPLETELGDPELLAKLERPGAEFDATHRAWVRGIYPGTYTLRGRADDVFIEFDDDGEWVEELELTFGDRETKQLAARTVKAGSVAGRLFCKEGEPLPSSVDVVVVPSMPRPVDPLDFEWRPETVLATEQVLGGKRRDAFLVGPLEPESYIVAFKPSTFDRWTWAVGTENGHEAQIVEVKRGHRVELGDIGVECGPAIHVTVIVGSGAAPPDLGFTRWSRQLKFASVVVTADKDRYEVDHPTVERHERLLVLRDFREGTVEGELQLGNPYFVPDFWVTVSVAGELERGRTLALDVPVADVGGALEVVDVEQIATHCRLTDADGASRTTVLDAGAATLTNLPTGSYRVEFCADAECQSIVAEPETVEIERVKTTELRH